MIRGSCLCGQVKYEIRGQAQFMYYCHCSMCRKASGSSFATNMMIAAEDLVLTSGDAYIKGYESSPNEFRYFCSECGSPIYGQSSAREGLLSIRCGSLNEDPGTRPQAHFHSKSKAPWFEITDQLRHVRDESS